MSLVNDNDALGIFGKENKSMFCEFSQAFMVVSMLYIEFFAVLLLQVLKK